MENAFLYPFIFSRKSTRNFENAPLAEDTLNKIDKFISAVKPLLPEPKISHKIVSYGEVSGMGLPKAPHYILITGEKHPYRNICAGFLYQHAELYLYSLGLAARWIASARSKKDDSDSIVGIAFGKPAVPSQRSTEEFNRKPLAEIAKGTDTRLEAARLAPSGLNAQPWFFIANGGLIHVYCQKSLGGLVGIMYKLTDLDVGIALCHIAVASAHERKKFSFNPGRKDILAPPKGFKYAGTVE